MSRKWLSLAMSVLAVIASVIATNVLGTNPSVARADQGSAPTVISEGTDQGRREIQADGEAPDISFIDSPGATCYRASVGVCYLQWSYLSVSASTSQYIISLTVSIDGRLRSYHSGFFQTSMYIPDNLLAPGFKVACGWRGASSTPGLGFSHSYAIRAAETGGLKAANYGTVICPADVGTIFMPITLKR